MGKYFVTPKLGMYMRHVRKSKNMTIRDMAWEIEMSPTTLWNLENTVNLHGVTRKTLEKIERGYSITLVKRAVKPEELNCLVLKQ